jgi:hypothetical protein
MNTQDSPFAKLKARFETQTTQQTGPRLPKFIPFQKGQCYIETVYNLETGAPVVDLMVLYDPDGEKVGVCEDNLEDAINVYKFTVKRPKKVKMHDSAPPVHWTDGLSQILACFNCGGKMFPDEGCDTVTHTDGCGRINYIAGGDGHSTKNVQFRYAVSRLAEDASLRNIKRALNELPEASAFWGLFEMIELFETDSKAWLKQLEKVESGLGVHESLQNLIASLKNLIKD